MRLQQWIGSMVLAGIAAMVVTGSGGCNKKEAPPAKGKSPTAVAEKDGKIDLKKGDHGWWCQEHGIPEDICSLCSDDVANKLKKEGDWCKIHDRAQSQCFKCNPKLYEKFEAMYVAKYNKKPEPPPSEEFEK